MIHKATSLSQRYALEEMVLRKYPEAITQLTERIAGYEKDVQLVAAHPKLKDGFVGMVILDTPYADKEAAGKAIIDVCTKMTGSDAVALGQYRSFSLTLSYPKYVVTLDELAAGNINGVKIMHLADFLLFQEY